MSNRLLESGDTLLIESGDTRLLEDGDTAEVAEDSTPAASGYVIGGLPSQPLPKRTPRSRYRTRTRRQHGITVTAVYGTRVTTQPVAKSVHAVRKVRALTKGEPVRKARVLTLSGVGRHEFRKQQTPESLAWIAERNREESALLLGLSVTL